MLKKRINLTTYMQKKKNTQIKNNNFCVNIKKYILVFLNYHYTISLNMYL